MRTAAGRTVRRRRWSFWIAGGVASFLLGAVLAIFATQQESLLAEVEVHPPIPAQKTPFRQWLSASLIGTPEAWESIEKYFPDNQYFVNRANQQLARIFLRERDLEGAKKKFEVLASLDKNEVELKAFGLAGLCGVLTMEGKYRESDAVIGQLFPIREKLTDRAMQQMLAYALRTNRSKLGESNEDLQKWLDEQFRAAELTASGPSAKK